MPYYSTASVLSLSKPGDLGSVRDIELRMRALLASPPKDRGTNRTYHHTACAIVEPFDGSQRLLRVQVCVDIDRLDDEAYREGRVAEARLEAQRAVEAER